MSATPGAHPPGVTRGQLLAAVTAELADVPVGARAVVALSGGPDSTALAHLVAEARDDLALTLAHVRHGLRDDTEDLAVVRLHAEWLGLALEVREVEVDPGGEGLEAAARRSRYRALREVAAEVGAEVVLVGHTADDQAETVLLRLARGTGIDGLTAMRTRTGDLLRPLLRLRRADVHRHVLLEGLPSVEDPHNLDPAVRRSVVRHRILPALEEVAPDPVGALARLAALATDDVEALSPPAAALAHEAHRVGPILVLPQARLLEGPVAIARRALRILLEELSDVPPPSAAALTRVLGLGPGEGIDLPGGVRASAGGGWLALAPATLPEQEPVELRSGDELAWAPVARRLRWLGPGDDAGEGDDSADGQIALQLTGAWTPPRIHLAPGVLPPGGEADAATWVLPEGIDVLRVRHRRPGDRLTTTAGTRRLSDFYVDRGVPRPVRACWPVVVDAEDRPVWIPGVAGDVEMQRRARGHPGGLLVLTADRDDGTTCVL